MASFDEYTFGLRNGLREAAVMGLSQLEEMITDVGYGWLDSYMEGVMESSSSKAPISDLMKTPGRTQKSRKTRVQTENAKTKGKKAAALANSDLAKSTSAVNPSIRRALSPLNPSSINTPPVLAASPVKGKGSKPPKTVKEKKTKAKTVGAGKRGRPKKVPDPVLEPDEGSEDVDMSKHGSWQDENDASPLDPIGETDELSELLSPVKSTSQKSSGSQTSQKSKKAQAKQTSPTVTMPDTAEPEEPELAERQIDDPHEGRATDVVLQSTSEQHTSHKAVDPHAGSARNDVGDKEIQMDAVKPNDVISQAQDRPIDTTEAEDDGDLELPDTDGDVPAPASVPIDNGTLPFEFPDFKVAPATVVRDKSIPVRQVRSSWLSKALGTATVPVTAPISSSAQEHSHLRQSILQTKPGTVQPDLIRKSTIAPLQQRVSTLPSVPVDFAAARKSLVQPGQLGAKRKSETLDDPAGTISEPVVRPDKLIKLDPTQHTTAPVAKPPTTSQWRPESLFSPPDIQPRRITPFGRSKVSTTSSTLAFTAPSTTPGPAVFPPAPQTSGGRGTTDNARSDIDKVTKRLDELRERAAAKTQAQALAVSGTKVSFDSKSSATTQSVSSGGGFFRGLGSLGRSLGLGGSSKHAEEEALKLQRELEREEKDQLEAEKELERLIAETPAPVVAKGEEDSAVAHDVASKAEDRIDQEDADSVMADLTADIDEQTVQIPAKESTPPPRSLMATLTSTTPVATPPRAFGGLYPRLAETTVAAHIRDDATMNDKRSTSARPNSPKAVRSPRSPRVPVKYAQSPPSRPVAKMDETSAAPPIPLKSPERAKRALPDASQINASSPKLRGQGPRQRVKSPVLDAQDRDNAAASPIRIPQSSTAAVRKAQVVDHGYAVSDEEDADLPDLPQPSERDADSDIDMDEEMPQSNHDLPAGKMFTGGATEGQMKKSASNQSIAPSLATSTASTSNMLNHASTIAGKTLGFKPTTGPVKSIALAAAAAKKEQATIDRKAQMREQTDQRKAQAAQRKAEEDRLKAEEEKRVRAAELEEKRKHRLALEKQRKEREKKVAAMAKEKADKEAEEAAAVAKIKAEQEANRKRKLLALGQKAPIQPAKKLIPSISVPASASNSSIAPKTQEPLRIVKPAVALPANGVSVPAQKSGPTHFRSVSTTNLDQHAPQGHNAERPVIGPPARPSTQTGHVHAFSSQQAAQRSSVQAHQSSTVASAVLQQSRVALQVHIGEKALEMQSEDIELPDIASEYSDSDDEDKSKDFIRPAWAESPELRHALQQQSTRDPDELFGPIKPVNMEELFKARPGKFRARSSSANWISTGDRLTRTEEIEYARRMGFRPIGTGGRTGGSTSTGGASRSSQA